MPKSLLLLLLLACCLLSCSKSGKQEKAASSDSLTTLTPPSSAPVEADSALNSAARFYAGVDCEGTAMSAADSLAWQKHAAQMGALLAEARESFLHPIDSLMKREASDAREIIDYVFYPCAGADFIFPFAFFPDADTYFLVGLEPAGTPIRQSVPDVRRLEACRSVLRPYFQSGFFVTKNMKGQLQREEIQGMVPVITQLMALSDCELVSATNCSFTQDGSIKADTMQTNLVELQFRRCGSSRLQRLFYLSADLSTSALDPLLQNYIATTLPKHRAATLLKAASYILRHDDTFGAIRQLILDHSIAILQDDSGIPYRCFDHRLWMLSLYGEYVKPRACFDADTYQPDLEHIYAVEPTVKPLPFHIGYARPSNWMIARKKKNPETAPLLD
ncbi:MAG: hypothetical protein KBT12_07920 [Bacteroidales bacterium]|nr:hypothetical protein [Candidatus Physcousia equi]